MSTSFSVSRSGKVGESPAADSILRSIPSKPGSGFLSPAACMATPLTRTLFPDTDAKPLAGQKRIQYLKRLSEESEDSPAAKRECIRGQIDEPAHGGAGKDPEEVEPFKARFTRPAFLGVVWTAELELRESPLEKKDPTSQSAFDRISNAGAEPVFKIKEALDLRKTSQRVQDAVAFHAPRITLPVIAKIPGRKTLYKVAVISDKEAYPLKKKYLIGMGSYKRLHKVKNAFNGVFAATYTDRFDESMHMREISILNCLKGLKGVIQLHAVIPYSTTKGVPKVRVILPYYNFGSLANVIDAGMFLEMEKDKKGIPLEVKKMMAQQMLIGLANVHRQGFIHRDIKPDNILVEFKDDAWTVVLSDFGLALHSREIEEKRRRCGTSAWYAPEYRSVAASTTYPKDFSAVTTFEADIYAMGLSIYELFAIKPVKLNPDPAVLISKMDETHKDVPVNIQNLIKEMLSSDPSKRKWEAITPLLASIFR